MFKEIYEAQEKVLNKKKSEVIKEKRLRPGNIRVLLFTGRFQPFHLAHKLIAEKGLKLSKASKLVIGIVRGKETSKNKDKNPLDINFQTSLIKRVLPAAEIIEISNSFIPHIAIDLREKSYEVIGIVSGDDRKGEYNTQFKYFDNWKKANPKFIPPKIKAYTVNRTSKLTKDISATNVRKTISEGNEEEFRKMMPKEIWDSWNVLRTKISSSDVKDKESNEKTFDLESITKISNKEFEELIKKLNIGQINQGYFEEKVSKKNKNIIDYIYEYTSAYYANFRRNYVLAKNKNFEKLSKVQQKAIIVNESCKINNIKEKEIYRGLSFKTKSKRDEVLRAIRKEKEINLDAMTSFTTYRNIAVYFAETGGNTFGNDDTNYGIMLTVINNNLKGLNVKSISDIEDEEEVIIAAEQKLKLKNIKGNIKDKVIHLELESI